ncbi:MAG: hypothetical protein KAX30_08320 [Candidatus Atribacteria bacterium]|jgi:hypothetical protein|nr:hypothetical protein [Candidatus Atribacteria bacterium]
MKRKEILILLLILLMLTLITGCAPSVTPVLSSAKKITSYLFKATINPVLSSDIEGTIDSDNHTISLTVPHDTTLTSLVATFTLSSDATAKIGTISQISDTTSNDFTSTVIYTVTAENGSTQDWVVSVEKANPVRYVATDGDDTNEGSEEHPWLTIQYALDTIPAPGTIRVKDGVYNENITFPSNKKIILKSVNSYSFTTIIGDNDLPTVTGSNSLEGTTLDGFTISHNSGDTGRGIEISGGYLNIDNCTISHNSTASHGGGIYNDYGTLTITASTISYNSASRGGGIYNNYGTLTITASTISHNSAAYGSGIGNRWGTLTIIESTISHNSALSYGGGIYNWGTLTIIISTISHNSAVVNGGGIRNTGTLTITAKSTISYNSATAYGGGICNYGTLTITASTISSNSAAEDGGGIYLDLGSEIPIPTIGGSGEENTICGNYKTGNEPFLDQQIRNDSGSLYDTYSSTNYISASCPL